MTSETALRVVFAGTPHFAAHFLQFLTTNEAFADNGDQIVGVYTQPDRPAGRGKKLQASPVKQLAEQCNLPIFQPLNFKSDEAVEQLDELKPDLMIVVAYGLILPASVLSIPRLGCINIHASVLPRWRGAAPIQRAIEAGDKTSGVTIMQMDVGLDTGDMLVSAECDISSTETGGSLHDKLMSVGEQALEQTLQQIRGKQLHPVKQDDSESTYAPKISKQEATIDWSEPAEVIDRKIRAFHPFPIAHSEISAQRVRVHQAAVQKGDTADRTPGTILAATEAGIDVSTGEGMIRIQRLQLPGKRALSVADVLRGNARLFAVDSQFEQL